MTGIELHLSPAYVKSGDPPTPLWVQCDVCYGMYQDSMTLNYRRIQFFTLYWRVW